MGFSFLDNLNIKKIVLVILFLILCVGLGFGIYWLFFKPKSPSALRNYLPAGGTLPNVNYGPGGKIIGPSAGGGLPEANGKAPGEAAPVDSVAHGGNTSALPLYDGKAVGVALSADGQGINFYNPTDNKFYTLSNDGKHMSPLSNQEFYQVQNVYWNSDRSQAIIVYPDGNKILYDFIKNKQVTLSKEISEPDFSKQDEIAYKYVSSQGDNNWLAVADAQGTQVKLIEPLGDNADLVQVLWSPTNQVVALYAKPIGLDKSEVFFIGLRGENFKSLVVDGSNFKGLWSPTGTKLLYQAVNGANNFNPTLWVVDAEGDNIGRHKFNLGLSTWVDKCVFADNLTLYCAVPRQLPEGMGLYPEYLGITHDLIYKIDLATGMKELIANPVAGNKNNFSISKMYVSHDKRFLFFWDSNTEQVYRLQLK